jgi:hypothetical protein
MDAWIVVDVVEIELEISSAKRYTDKLNYLCSCTPCIHALVKFRP